MTEKLAIGEGTEIRLNFSLALEDGEIIDSNFGSPAVSFNFGDGSLLPGFEKVLLGLYAGRSETFTIAPEHGFGQHNPSNIQIVERRNFDPNITLEEGLVVSFADAAGGEVPGVVRGADEKEVEVDFNHPLAGRTITFKVEIHSVSPISTH